jgi:ketosteroid isomerase-like protein
LQLDASNAGVQPKLALIKDIFAPGSKTVRVASNKAAASPGAASPATAPATSPAAAAATSAKALVPAAAPVAANPATPAIVPTVAPVAKRPTVVAAPPLAANTTKPAAAANKTDGAEAKDPANTTPAAKNDDEQAVEAAVRAWARAWAKKDMHGYYAAYGSSFRPADGASRSAWEADRKARIVGKNKIQVEVSNIRVTVNGDKATARFRQDYQGDALRISSNKSLAFSKEGQRWVIAREMAGN